MYFIIGGMNTVHVCKPLIINDGFSSQLSALPVKENNVPYSCFIFYRLSSFYFIYLNLQQLMNSQSNVGS